MYAAGWLAPVWVPRLGRAILFSFIISTKRYTGHPSRLKVAFSLKIYFLWKAMIQAVTIVIVNAAAK